MDAPKHIFSVRKHNEVQLKNLIDFFKFLTSVCGLHLSVVLHYANPCLSKCPNTACGEAFHDLPNRQNHQAASAQVLTPGCFQISNGSKGSLEQVGFPKWQNSSVELWQIFPSGRKDSYLSASQYTETRRETMRMWHRDPDKWQKPRLVLQINLSVTGGPLPN